MYEADALEGAKREHRRFAAHVESAALACPGERKGIRDSKIVSAAHSLPEACHKTRFISKCSPASPLERRRLMLWAFFGTIVLLWFLGLIVFGFGTVIHAIVGLRRAFKSSAAAGPADTVTLETQTIYR